MMLYKERTFHSFMLHLLGATQRTPPFCHRSFMVLYKERTFYYFVLHPLGAIQRTPLFCHRSSMVLYKEGTFQRSILFQSLGATQRVPPFCHGSEKQLGCQNKPSLHAGSCTSRTEWLSPLRHICCLSSGITNVFLGESAAKALARDLRPAQPLFISLGSKAFSQLAYWDLETAAKPLKKLTRVDTEILSGWYTLAKL